jgi:hypothetical protein
MKTRFRVDLIHPGADVRHGGRVAQTGEQWFLGSGGARRLGIFTLAAVGILVLVLVGLILPPYWRLSGDLSALPGLRRDLVARETDLNVLRSNVTGLTDEARRQLRWGDLLATLSQQIPPTVKLQLVDAGRAAPGGAGPPQAGAAVRTDNTIRIDAITPLRPGSPPLLEVAQFMAGLVRDPAVNKRFRLKSWEIKPSASGVTGEGQFLNISIFLAERSQ